MAEPRGSAARQAAGAPSDIAAIALERYRFGDLKLAAQIALAALSSGDRTTPGLAELAARAAIRTGDAEIFERALDYLRPTGGDAQRWLRGAFLVRFGDPDEGIALLRDALGPAPSGVPGEVAYHLAVGLWNKRDLDGAESVVQRYRRDAVDVNAVELEQMLGWIEQSRERYAFAGRHFAAALALLDAARQPDEWGRARILNGLAAVSLETLDLHAIAHLAVAEASVGAEAQQPMFHALQSVAWLRMLDGDESGALIDIERARAIAPTAALVAAADITRARYFRIVGDAGAARVYLQLGGEALRSQRWSDANADERMTLLEYALEAARLEPTLAGPTLTRYLSGTRKRKGALAFENDRRVQALELMARGALEAFHKRHREASQYYREALDIWARLGYRYREALTALLLDDVGPGDEQVRDAARRATASIPKSWLRREVERRTVRVTSGYDALSPAERRVMLAICEGKTSKQIAADFGRSFHTIRNQTLKVYATMGVRTRSALVAECARLGLLR
jgi:DNA-binding CsgD family transcriptional regulator/tetratricopeptide (TPR) repeat protein